MSEITEWFELEHQWQFFTWLFHSEGSLKLECQNLKTQPILYRKSLACYRNNRLPVREGDSPAPSIFSLPCPAPSRPARKVFSSAPPEAKKRLPRASLTPIPEQVLPKWKSQPGPSSDHSLPMSATNWLTALSNDLVKIWKIRPLLIRIRIKLWCLYMHIYVKNTQNAVW